MKTARLTHLILAALLLACTLVRAQAQYSIGWSKIAGGGGIAEIGPYTLTSAIGQPDASGMETFGSYSFDGGFLAPLIAQPEDACLSLLCSNLVVGTCGPCTNVNLAQAVTASDVCCSNGVTLSFNLPTNTCFGVNTTNIVQVTAQDGCGNTASNTFTVTVISCSACLAFYNATNMVISTCSTNCVVPQYNVTVADLCCPNGPPTLTFVPPAGTCFAPGTTNVVTCIATSPCGYTNMTNFSVTVAQTPDTLQISAPTNLTVSTTCPSAQVFYDVTASSSACSNVAVTVNPPSGSFLPVGTNTVTAVAEDCCGNFSSNSFTVTVMLPPPCIAGQNWNLQTGFTNSTNNIGILLASSSDGNKLVAVVNEGPIYTSSDAGVAWQGPFGPVENWTGVASSADGTKLVAVANGGGIFTSTNSGVTWTGPAQNTAGVAWACVASSSDGSKLAAGVGAGLIYTSTNSGMTWTAQSHSETQNWGSMASSADGTKLVAGGDNGDINISTNSGVTWVQPFNEFRQTWNSFASSADGIHLAAAGYPDGIWISTNSGANWTNVPGLNGSYWTVATSSDGSDLVAAPDGFDATQTGPIYTSTNGGATWTPQNSSSSQFWTSVASSSDGSKLVAVGNNGGIHTSVCANMSACCVPPPPNMVLWLPFDETSGSVSANLASPQYYGTQVSHPTPYLNAYVANSLNFNGSNYVTVPDYSAIEIGTQDMTIDAWVNFMAGTPTNTVILSKYGTNNETGYGLQMVPSEGLLFFMDGQTYVSGQPIATNGWHFIAVSVSRNTNSPVGYFYVDGTQVGTFTPITSSLANTNELSIASAPSGAFDFGQPWTGPIDEVEIYNRGLSTTELNLIYGAGTAGKCKPPCYLQTIHILRVSPTSVEVIWEGSAVLLQAPTPDGPWTPIENAASPYVITPAGRQMYYRLDCPY